MQPIARILIALLLIIVGVSVLPARAASVPSLKIWSANDRGLADLLPGGRVQVVVELRSDDRRSAALSVATPAGFVLESESASAGSLAASPSIAWTGEVSSTQPINLVVNYRVAAHATPGDRAIGVAGQAGNHALAAANVLRVCCIAAPAPPRPISRVYLPVVLR